MGLEKIGFGIQRLVRPATCTQQVAKKVTSVFCERRINPCVTKVFKCTFDDIYSIKNLGNGRIKLIPKVSQFNGKDILPIEMPEYLYHFTSASKLKLIKASNKIQISLREQLPGVYLLDKENFLTKYINVGSQKRNLCKSMLAQASINSDNGPLVVIRIPTENLLRNGKLRIRTQEDFFYFQDKVYELQKGLKQKFSLRSLCVDINRMKLKKHVLDNNLMPVQELERFMKEMEQKIHQGYRIDKLSKLEKNNAVEFIFDRDILPDIVHGMRTKYFSVDELIDAKSGKIDIDKLRHILT